jgi:hypothetical protein
MNRDPLHTQRTTLHTDLENSALSGGEMQNSRGVCMVNRGEQEHEQQHEQIRQQRFIEL